MGKLERRGWEKNIGGVDQGWDGIKEAMPSPGGDEGKMKRGVLVLRWK